MAKKIRLGVVGLGHRGVAMLATAACFDSVAIAAVCDCNVALIDPIREKYPAAAGFADFGEMLDSGLIDVLLVETPATNHAGFCAAALRKNIHVFSDIPSVADLHEARMLWESSKTAKSLFMTGANPNMWGFVEAMYDFHRRGLLGDLYYLEAEYIHDVQYLMKNTPWRRTLPPIKYCTHSLGPLQRLIADDFRKVSCFTTGSWINRLPDENDLMSANFRTESGVVAHLTISFFNNAGCGQHSYRVFGTDGYFEHLSARGREPARTAVKSRKLYGLQTLTELPIALQRPEYADVPGGHGGADYALLKAFFDAIEQGSREAPIALREGLRMTLPGLYAAESARRGGELLSISYPWDQTFDPDALAE